MNITQIPSTLPPAITISRDTAVVCLAADLDDYGASGPVALAWRWALTGNSPTPDRPGDLGQGTAYPQHAA